MSRDTLTKLFKHYKDNGISLRQKQRGGRRNTDRRILSHEDVLRVVTFISNYTEENVIILPGRHPGHKRFDIKHLPSHVTKAMEHRNYKAAMEQLRKYSFLRSFSTIITNEGGKGRPIPQPPSPTLYLQHNFIIFSLRSIYKHHH